MLLVNRIQGPQERKFKSIKIAYQWDRDLLYERINIRVEDMISKGLIAEAQNFSAHKESTALDTIGYKEVFQFLDGTFTKEEAIDLVKRNSRRYAKRQSTWFQKDTDIHWFSPLAQTKDIVKFINETILN
jgi:tRNA dimethylallyltransferase